MKPSFRELFAHREDHGNDSGEPEQFPPLPTVDPNARGLDDLFAWGRAIALRGHITPERSQEILRLVRQYVKDRR